MAAFLHCYGPKSLPAGVAVMEGRMHNSGGAAENRIETLDAASFQTMVLEARGRIAVEFMSYGCAYCRAIEPLLQQVAGALARDVTIYRINITADPALAEAYGIGGTPTFVMFLNGTEMGRTEGPSPDLASVQDAVAGPFVA